MNIAVIGTGYVGLVTGTCFAEMGNHVICVDVDERKVKSLSLGELTIYEPGLEDILQRNLEQERIRFTMNLKEAVNFAEMIFLALPTPPGEDGSADLTYILEVAHQLGDLIQDRKIIVNKSTVPVGTAEMVKSILSKKLKSELFEVASNPEFLREGSAVGDFMKPDRVIVGLESKTSEAIFSRLYSPYLRQGNPIFFMDLRSAELAKYAANAYLAARISFINEIANLCEKVGADVEMIRKGLGSDERIGKSFLYPGLGYGGSCFPKDVKALQKTALDYGYDFKILKSVIEVNTRQRLLIVDKIKNYFGHDLNGRKIAVWGLSFKPMTDDIREAPSITIIEELLKMDAEVNVFDPEAMENVRREFGKRLSYADDQYKALVNTDALVIVTEWSMFRTPSFGAMKKLMKQSVIFDGRNLYDPKLLQQEGFHYESVGRAKIKYEEV